MGIVNIGIFEMYLFILSERSSLPDCRNWILFSNGCFKTASDWKICLKDIQKYIPKNSDNDGN